jgi:hypothetical protein
MARRYFPKNIEELVYWYQRYISPLSLIAGFLADNFILLRRVDLLRTNLLLFFYLIVVALGIIAINYIASGRVRNKKIVELAPLIPVVVQFAFGGLFSGYLSLYSRSASIAVSWIFVGLLAALLLGNERFMRFYTQFSFQITLYFAVLFSFLIFYLPVVFHQIGPYMFIGSGLVSLALIVLFLYLLSRLIPEIVTRNRTSVARAIALLYVAFNVFYFLNLIPPLPLSLKSAGVYHNVTHTADGTYLLTAEPVPWYESFFRYNTTFHEAPDDTVYVFTSIFAPTGLSTTIVHQWQHYDTAKRAWVTKSAPSFWINGGRDGGYRGYSYANNLAAGSWRVNVLTQYGQLIGRVTFSIKTVVSPPQTQIVSQ